MRAAVPNYLQAHIGQAAPGHRFGLYYAGWNDDLSATKTGKTEVLKALCTLPEHSQTLHTALLARQSAQAAALAPSTVLTLPLLSSSPFATGLGNEHPLENGFSFLSPYGLPYLPGSGVKGVLRRAAEELASGDWGAAQGWSQSAIDALFGPGEQVIQADPEAAARQGALIFWDVLPRPAKQSLAVEIMTPHLGDYYQGKKSPNTSLLPVPIPFLALPAGSGFMFHVQCQLKRLPDASLRESWRALVETAFEHAGQWLGFGAKTAVGYGRMGLDPQEIKRRQQAQQQALEAQQKAEKAAREQALPPAQKLLSQLADRLALLPKDPRNGQALLQKTDRPQWKETLDWLTSAAPTMAACSASEREALAAEVKKRLQAHYKVEGNAEKAMKSTLATLRTGP